MELYLNEAKEVVLNIEDKEETYVDDEGNLLIHSVFFLGLIGITVLIYKIIRKILGKS